MSKKQKRDVYQEVTDKVIAMLEEHGKDWTKPFLSGAAGGMPKNAVTGNYYRGINVVMLGFFNPYDSNEFASYKQWQAKGAQVRKGEKGFQVVFFKVIERENKETGETDRFPMARFSTVFNARQVDGYEPEAKKPLEDLTEILAHVDEYVNAVGAKIIESGDGAWYRPSTDEIGMPSRDKFTDTDTSSATENYYSTLLHELTHWTGHKDRLARLDEKNLRGYAFEELVAELGAAINCVALGISSEPRADHAKYLNNWLAALKDDKRYIFRAAALAHNAVEFLDDQQDDYVEEAA